MGPDYDSIGRTLNAPAAVAEERRHSRSLAGLIRAQLAAAGGWLSFERFMELALYAPAWVTTSAGSVKIGVGGDFVTAPRSVRSL